MTPEPTPADSNSGFCSLFPFEALQMGFLRNRTSEPGAVDRARRFDDGIDAYDRGLYWFAAARKVLDSCGSGD